ncbi:MAG: PaaI family thioesterase [Pseudomonadota bacterium]
MDHERLAAIINDCPFHEFLNMAVEAADPDAGVVVIRLPFAAGFARSKKAPQIHGGITAALIDIAGVYAIATVIGRTVPTINMSVDYLRMAEGSDLIARARVIKAGRSIGVADIEVSDDADRLIAVGRGTYSTV